MSKKALYYRVSVTSDRYNDYEFAEIDVWPSDIICSVTDASISFSWQGDVVREGDRRWYAFEMKVEAVDKESFDRKVRVVRRIVSLDTYSDTQPEDILSRLEEIATEVVYDSRLSEFVPLDKVLPDEFRRWIDDYEAMGKRYCTVGCMARSETEARMALLNQLAENSYYFDYVKEWLVKDAPVREIKGDKMPSLVPAREFLKREAEEEGML